MSPEKLNSKSKQCLHWSKVCQSHSCVSFFKKNMKPGEDVGNSCFIRELPYLVLAAVETSVSFKWPKRSTQEIFIFCTSVAVTVFTSCVRGSGLTCVCCLNPSTWLCFRAAVRVSRDPVTAINTCQGFSELLFVVSLFVHVALLFVFLQMVALIYVWQGASKKTEEMWLHY